MTALRCGAELIDVEPALLVLAAERCLHYNFRADGVATLKVRRVARLRRPTPLVGSRAPWGSFEREGDSVLAHIPDDKWAAESVIRVAWYFSTVQQGGVLMHGSGFAWEGHGYAALGQSTAGKSTLARLCCGLPGNATLLTDEIVQLFPDGRLYGTPFRSDTETPGAVGGVQLEPLLLLRKGPVEALEPEPPARVMPELLGQLYKGPPGDGWGPECTRRVLRLVDRVGLQRLTFRKDPQVGLFLRNRLPPPAG